MPVAPVIPIFRLLPSTAVPLTPVSGLYIIGSGKALSAACELLRGDNMKKLVDEVREKFDMVFIDTPPLNLVTDAELVYPLIDFGLYVLHYGRHSISEIKEAVEKMRRYAQKPGAFVMNHCEHEPGHYGYGYYRYGYGYGYGYGHKKGRK